MTTSPRSWIAGFALLMCAVAATAGAQPGAQNAGSSNSTETRSALTTADGDTGLWFVPTAEVLARGKWSASGYRVGLNYVQGFSNVADFPLTFAASIGGRAEVFGSFKAVTRVDRDLRPLFTSNVDVGGVIGRYPDIRTYWAGNKRGDLLVGAKVSLLSEANAAPVAVAIRGTVKLPTGDDEAGVSTGQSDGTFDLIISKYKSGVAELSAYGGAVIRGSGSGVSQSNGFRWGVGADVPARGPLHITGELNGERPFDDTVVLSAPIIAIDGTVAPTSSTLRAFTAATVGATYQLPAGFFVGAGITWSLPTESRSAFNVDSNPSTIGDFADFQFRIGYHPGMRRNTATFSSASQSQTSQASPASEPSAATPPAPAAQAAAGQTPSAADQSQGASAAGQPSPSQGGGASGAGQPSSAQASAAPLLEIAFEDVYFDFDRSALRPDALRLLDEAVGKLQADPSRNILIEGHTCNIGTSEYNLALGERRARSVQTYLTSRGVAANRLEIVSYGEEQPKFDNSREETRRLNRRAALVVKVQ